MVARWHFRIVCVWPFGPLDYGAALHPGEIQGKEGIKFCHLATRERLSSSLHHLREKERTHQQSEGGRASFSPSLESVLSWEWELFAKQSWCRNVRSALRTFSSSRPGHPCPPPSSIAAAPPCLFNALPRPSLPLSLRPSVRLQNSEYGSVSGARRSFLSLSLSLCIPLSLSLTLSTHALSERSLPQ